MKKALVFLDYNGTIEDILLRGGKVFNNGISKFINFFQGNVDIVIITSAKASRLENNDKTENELKEELTSLFSILPPYTSKHFKFLLQSSLKKIDKIDIDNNSISFNNLPFNINGYSKKEGVEEFLKQYDPLHEYSTCVFCGDSIVLDLPMLDANTLTQDKYFIFPAPTKKHIKLNDDITYKLSFNPSKKLYYSNEENDNIPKDLKIIRTASKSYGVGKGFEYLTTYLSLKEKINTIKEKPNDKVL